ncbi:MAG: NAD-dependent epimerase/dehydratase family protein [Umezawaea sp.]
MRILVTGGAGFIGSQAVGRFLAAGHEVRVLDRLVPSAHPDGVYTPPAGVDFWHGDVADPDLVAGACRGMDLVSHQAAMVGRGKEILDGPNYVHNNDLGTATLLKAMTEAGIGRLVLASSVVIYGDSRYDCPLHGRVRASARSRADLNAGRFEPRCGQCGTELTASAVEEDDVLDPPRNVYAVTKLAQEYLVGAWTRETGGTAAVLRYHNVYGPGMPFDSPYSGVTATFRSSVELGEAPRVYEDGLPRRDFVHVADVAEANLAALAWTRPGFRAFTIASGEPRSIGELAATMAAFAGAPEPVITGEYRIGDVRHIFASPKRAITELGWRPAVSFDDGITEFVGKPMRRG